ncbi:MAG: hypothetical protein QM527_14625 [Alphaproteobacteria bacterium]|nr:hypothetical protein [Alphaproteobacteria bacterium]
MNSSYVRFTYILLACWVLGLGYVAHWFFSLGDDPGLSSSFVSAHYTWSQQQPPRGGPEPRLDGLVIGAQGTGLILPPMPSPRETDILRPSNVKKQSEIRTCFWPGPRARIGLYTTDPDHYSHEANLADLGRTSALTWFKLPSEGKLVLQGQFPHARLLSLVAFDERGQALDWVADHAIEPDGGSENPFRRGVRRDTPKRNYTLTIVSGKPPAANRPANTLYTQNASGTPIALQLQVYVPDRDRDWTGGVGLPQVALHLPTKQILAEKETCEQTLVSQRGKPQPKSGWWPNVWLALNQLPWRDETRSPAEYFDATAMRRFFSLEYTALSSYVPLLDLFLDYFPQYVHPDVREMSWSDPYTQFGYTPLNLAYGRIYAVQGRLPSTPRSWDQPNSPMSDQAEMRYWSLCTSSFPVTGTVVDCVHDENLRTLLDPQGNFTVVVSRLADRPQNATERCGVLWLEAGHGDAVPGGSKSYAALINRHTLVDPEFKRTWSEVESPRKERQVFGVSRPVVLNQTDKDRFELLGCPVSTISLDRLRLILEKDRRR